MSSYFEISPAHHTLTLEDGRGTAGFAVRCAGKRRVEMRAVAVPMQGTEEGWLNLESPAQVEMAPGQTQTFKVKVGIPPGTSPGRYGLRLDVLSVDNPDEEYERGPMVSFEIEASEKPKQRQGFPWWAVALVAVFLVFMVGGIMWWLSPNGQPTELTIEQIYGSNQCQVDDGKVLRLITNPAELRELTSPTLGGTESEASGADVDFVRNWVVLVGWGSRPNPGYGLTLAEDTMRISNGAAHLPVAFQTPSPGQMYPQVVVSPCLVVALPKGDYRNVSADGMTVELPAN